MSHHRFFLSSTLPKTDAPLVLPLSRGDVHHAVHVLRLQPGEHVAIVEPGGAAHLVRLEVVAPEGLVGRVISQLARPKEPHITLIQGIVKGSGMDEIIRHAVELGAERIVPLVCERTVVRLEPAKADARVSRWQRIAESAARQSQRARVPGLEPPVGLPEVVAQIGSFDVCIVLWEESADDSLSTVLRSAGVSAGTPESRVALVVGPEGGLTVTEVEALVSGGASVASLGPAVLRADTAALAALTLTADALGAL